METVTHPGGVVESWDRVLGYKRLAYDGRVLEERPLTAAELARLVEFEAAPVRESNRSQLHTQARAALTSNAAYLAKVDAGTATQADHLTQVGRLTRQTNALIRLVIGSDLLDEETP